MAARRALAIIGNMNILSISPGVPRDVPSTSRTVGDLLREWRQRRRMSQLLLAAEADISTRHLSFVESGRALPSREMVMHLAERLEVPLRARNTLLVAAGYAPLFRERPLTDPQLSAAREAVELVLKGHEPYPALADRRRQSCARTVGRRSERGVAGSAGQRAAPEPASGGHCVVHRQLACVARACAGAAATAGRGQRRRYARCAARRAGWLSYAPWRPKPGGRQQRR